MIIVLVINTSMRKANAMTNGIKDIKQFVKFVMQVIVWTMMVHVLKDLIHYVLLLHKMVLVLFVHTDQSEDVWEDVLQLMVNVTLGTTQQLFVQAAMEATSLFAENVLLHDHNYHEKAITVY